MTTPTAYSIYLIVSLVTTVWVARTLHRRGRVFLVDAMRGNEDLADSINSLLVVGFYLVNFGYVLLALKYGRPPEELVGAIEALATKIGLVLLILGVMHFINVFVISGMRRRGLDEAARGARWAAAKTNLGELSGTINPEAVN